MRETITTESQQSQCEPASEKGKAMSRGWSRKVKVVAKPGAGPDPVDFSLESDLKDPGSGELVFNKTKDNMPKRDHYLIEFDLDDRSGLNLQFAPNPMDALWVNMDSTSCPTKASYSNEVYAVCVEGDELTVRNEDDRPAMFAFSLGFLKRGADPKDPNSYIRYDPIGSNQNGGI